MKTLKKRLKNIEVALTKPYIKIDRPHSTSVQNAVVDTPIVEDRNYLLEDNPDKKVSLIGNYFVLDIGLGIEQNDFLSDSIPGAEQFFIIPVGWVKRVFKTLADMKAIPLQANVLYFLDIPDFAQTLIVSNQNQGQTLTIQKCRGYNSAISLADWEYLINSIDNLNIATDENAAAIATNKADIATNKADIVNNTTEITANTESILRKQSIFREYQYFLNQGGGENYLSNEPPFEVVEILGTSTPIIFPYTFTKSDEISGNVLANFFVKGLGTITAQLQFNGDDILAPQSFTFPEEVTEYVNIQFLFKGLVIVVSDANTFDVSLTMDGLALEIGNKNNPSVMQIQGGGGNNNGDDAVIIDDAVLGKTYDPTFIPNSSYGKTDNVTVYNKETNPEYTEMYPVVEELYPNQIIDADSFRLPLMKRYPSFYTQNPDFTSGDFLTTEEPANIYGGEWTLVSTTPKNNVPEIITNEHGTAYKYPDGYLKNIGIKISKNSSHNGWSYVEEFAFPFTKLSVQYLTTFTRDSSTPNTYFTNTSSSSINDSLTHFNLGSVVMTGWNSGERQFSGVGVAEGYWKDPTDPISAEEEKNYVKLWVPTTNPFKLMKIIKNTASRGYIMAQALVGNSYKVTDMMMFEGIQYVCLTDTTWNGVVNPDWEVYGSTTYKSNTDLVKRQLVYFLNDGTLNKLLGGNHNSCLGLTVSAVVTGESTEVLETGYTTIDYLDFSVATHLDPLYVDYTTGLLTLTATPEGIIAGHYLSESNIWFDRVLTLLPKPSTFITKYVVSTGNTIAPNTSLNLFDNITDGENVDKINLFDRAFTIANGIMKLPIIKTGVAYTITVRLFGTMSGASVSDRIFKIRLERLNGEVLVSDDIVKVTSNDIDHRAISLATFTRNELDEFITDGFKLVLDNSSGSGSSTITLTEYQILIVGSE